MKTIFLTFGTTEINGSKARLKYKAIECGWFDEVYSLNENDITDNDFLEMKRLHWNENFHGFYFFKPFSILEIFNKLNDGDILIYVDSGSDINLNGKQFFNEKIKLLNEGKYSILGYGMTSIGAFSPSEVIKNILNINDINDDILDYPQIQAGIIYIKKNNISKIILNEWKNNMIKYYDILKMNFEKIIDKDNNRFIQSRCDQTCLGLLSYKYKNDVLLLKPDYDWMDASRLNSLEIRLSNNDILPTRKKFNYKPFVLFCAGHVIPQYEKYFDSYTHFIDVGNNNLNRCTSITHDNVGDLDDLAELTALYYIWKNIDLSDVKYIGFETYRKPFCFSNDKLFDIIDKDHNCCIANKFYQNRLQTHLTSFDKKYIEEFREFFKSIYPDDYEEFCKHQESGILYPCNSFVMNVENFYKLCEYVFKIIIPYAKTHIGMKGKTTHSPFTGVFGEDLTSFFIYKTFKHITSVPFLVYPYYKRSYNANTPGNFPVIFGSIINDKNEELFWPFAELPLVEPIIKKNFKDQITDNDFFDSRDYRQQPQIFPSKNYLIKK